ncbi:MAG: hypothetical protein IJ833_00750 [Lachnospiraceae bacterium]|nr:hypothetical protein [Lachnospiraceae bacterium]
MKVYKEENGVMVEDIENPIYKEFDDILDALAAKPKEERLKWFAEMRKPKELDFVKKIGDTYYVVRSHFDKEGAEDTFTKVHRIVLNEN